MKKMPAFGLPATDLVVTYKGQTVYRNSVGFSDAARTKPVTDLDIYYLFSVSKVTTCISCMRLVEEGRLQLDAPVADYLPSFSQLTIRQEDGTVKPYEGTVTVRQLFTMTCGMNYDLLMKPITELRKQNANFTTMDAVNAMAKNPLSYVPGTRWQYCLSHDVLAAVAEAVTGERFSDYVKRVVFDPLGMSDTGYHLPKEKQLRLSEMYVYQNGIMKPQRVEPINNYILSDRYDCGGAGLYSTANDQIRFLTVLANGGTTENGYTLLHRDIIRLLGENQLTDPEQICFGNSTHNFGYGFGLCCRTHQSPLFSFSPSAIGEFGWDGAAGSYALVDPSNAVAVFFATHVRGCGFAYNRLHPMLRNSIYEALGIGSGEPFGSM